MAINKRKILQSAQKHLQKGALDKALKDYQTLLEADPGDANLRLKVGDIHLRRGETGEAVAAYLRVAAQFMKDGFDAKSVAIYKQVTKIDPERHEVHQPLAELYQRMGLVSEAMGALQNAADLHHRAGRKRDALDLLRKMATLDPTNTTSRLKLAELLRQAGLDKEAASEYREVAAELERQGDPEGMTGALEKLLAFEPGDVDALERMAAAQLASQHPDRAEPFARRVVELDPDKPSGYEMLARVYQAMQRSDALPDVYRRLAEAHRRRGDEDQARSILQRFVPAEPFDRRGIEAEAPEAQPDLGRDLEGKLEFDEGDLAGPGLGEDLFASDGTLDLGSVGEETFVTAQPMIRPAAGGDATPLPSLDREPGSAASEPTPEGSPEQLFAEASVYLRYAKHDRAIACLEALLRQDENHQPALEKLADAYEAVADVERAVDAWVRAAEAARRTGDASAYERLRDRIAVLDERAAQALPVGTGTPAAPEKPEEAPDLLEELSLGDTSQPSGFDGVTEQFGFDTPEQSGPAVLDDPVEIELEPSAEATPLPGTLEPEVAASPPESPHASAQADTEDGEWPSGRVAEQLEEAAFYREQGMLEEAEEVYRRILAVIPGHPQAQLHLGEIAAARGQCPSEVTPPATASEAGVDDQTPDPFGDVDLDAEFGSTDAGEAAAPVSEPAGPSPPASPASAIEIEVDEADAEAPAAVAARAEVGTGARERGVGRAETTEPDLASLDEEDAATDEGPARDDEGFDLAEALSEAFGVESPTGAGTAEEGFHALFRDFKRGIEQTLSAEDGEARYDLGIAYREMGLLEDALGEFEVAQRAPQRRLDALHMIAVCQLDLSRPGEAFARLEEALKLESTAAQQAALRFDLGRAREALGEGEEALAAYREVARLEPDFPGLEERIRALAGGAPLAPAEGEGGFESFDDLFSDAAETGLGARGEEAAGDAGSAAEVSHVETGDAGAPDDAGSEPPSPPRRKKKISFL